MMSKGRLYLFFGLGLLVVVMLYLNFNKSPVVEKMELVRPSVAPTIVVEEKTKFGVMADVHMNWTDWKKFLANAKGRGESMVIVAGDMTSLGKREELVAAKKVLDESGMKYFVVPGNHDLWESTKTKRPLFYEVFGRDYQSFQVDKSKFILLNNGLATGLGTDQRLWLNNEVGVCRVINCVVVMHMPLNHNFSAHVMGEGNKKVTSEAVELIELFKNNGVKELITGHLHYSSSYELGGIRTNIVGAVSRERNTQTPRYTEFIMSDNQLERIVVEGEVNDIGN